MKMSRELKLVLFSNLFQTGDWSLITSSELQTAASSCQSTAERLVYPARVDVYERDILKPRDKLLLGDEPNLGLSHVAWINQRAL